MNLKSKPFIGIMAFIIVLFTMPLGHAMMILMQLFLGETNQYIGAIIVGLFGFAALLISLKDKNDTHRTFLGLFSGIFMWTGFVEFSFVFFAEHLSIMPILENGEVVTKPEYLLLPSTIGLNLSIIIYFLLNGQNRCNFFRWIRRLFKMNIPSVPDAKTKNYAVVTAMETILIMWSFYIVLMLAYDKTIFGDHHPFTYTVFFGALLWSLYLIIRLMKISKIAPAIRYAIPTVIIFWNAVEILGRWDFFKEIWVDPTNYILEMGLIFGAFIGLVILLILTPKNKKIE